MAYIRGALEDGVARGEVTAEQRECALVNLTMAHSSTRHVGWRTY